MASRFRFQWHARARLTVGRDPATSFDASVGAQGGLIAAEPVAHAVQSLFAAAQSGHPFRVGDDMVCPFQTLGRQSVFQCLTSGSSGQAKVIERTQSSWIKSFEVNGDLFGISPQTCCGILGGVDHSLALYGAVEGLHLGADVHALGGLRPDHQADLLLHNNVQILYATPTQLYQLARHGSGPLTQLRRILCGGGALPIETAAMITSFAPNAEVHVFYGAAETSFITLGNKETPPGAVGTAYPGVHIEIRNPDPLSGIGEVWVKSPYLFDGYAKGSSQTTKQQGGWVTVGELGHLDDAGVLWLKGRSSRQVTIADKNVSPEPMERALGPLAPDRTCVIVPVADALRGNRFVVVWSGLSDRRLSQETLALLRRQTPTLFVPKTVLYCDDMPLAAGGKTDLVQLIRWAEAQL